MDDDDVDGDGVVESGGVDSGEEEPVERGIRGSSSSGGAGNGPICNFSFIR